jgi:hypothetical protein
MCEEILINLMDHPYSQPFLKPVDPEEDGVADYSIIIRHPMDLGTILSRIKSGYYDNLQVEDLSKSSDRGLYSSSFSVGDKIDCYFSQTRRWYETQITALDKDGFTAHLVFWGTGHDIRLPHDTNFVAPLGHYSRDLVRFV